MALGIKPDDLDSSSDITPTYLDTAEALAPYIESRRLRDRVKRVLKSTWWILLSSFIALLVGIAGESIHEYFSPTENIADVSKQILGRIFSWSYLFHFIAEVGIALFIAWIVAVFIEARARDEQTDAFRAAIRHIGHSVIQGVYGIRHDKNYVKAVVSSCLAVSYIRRDVHVFYKVSELSPSECKDLGVEEWDYVRVRVEFTYDTINITEKPGVFEGVYTIPQRPGKFAPLARLNSLRVNGKEYSEDDRNNAEVRPGENHYNASDRTWRFDIPANPGEHVPVRIFSEFIKQRSDTEIFAFLLPTIGITIRFDFQLDGLSRVDAKSRTATPMWPQHSSQGHDREWCIPGSVLPNDYVAVWWVTDQDYIAARRGGASQEELAAWRGLPAGATERPALANPSLAAGSCATVEKEDHSNVSRVARRLRSIADAVKGAFVSIFQRNKSEGS